MNYTYTMVAGGFVLVAAVYCPLQFVGLRLLVAAFGLYLVLEYWFHPTVREERRKRRQARKEAKQGGI